MCEGDVSLAGRAGLQGRPVQAWYLPATTVITFFNNNFKSLNVNMEVVFLPELQSKTMYVYMYMAVRGRTRSF